MSLPTKAQDSESLLTKTVYEGKRQRTITVEKLGTEKELREKSNGADPYEWAKQYIEKLNQKEKEQQREVIIKYKQSKLLPMNKQRLFNGGYLFLQQLYYSQGMDKICSAISDKHKFTYDLNSVLSRLLYGRILFPSSKLNTCFRIMKTDFKSRPAYVRTDNRIKAHFMTCFLSLILFRYLEKALEYNYTCEDILDTLCNMNILAANGDGYIPTYTRTDLTDALHEAFGFRTDYDIVTEKQMKKIFRDAKKYAKFLDSKNARTFEFTRNSGISLLSNCQKQEYGMEPACVRVCPTQALRMVTEEEYEASHKTSLITEAREICSHQI